MIRINYSHIKTSLYRSAHECSYMNVAIQVTCICKCPLLPDFVRSVQGASVCACN